MDVFPWDGIHPLAKGAFMALADDLAKAYGLGMTPTRFRPFEGLRSPAKQETAFRAGATKARAWQSPHQYGLAVDFVARHGDTWSWAKTHDWAFLARCAIARGLECQTKGLEWDLAHCQHPVWHRLKAVLRPEISGSMA